MCPKYGRRCEWVKTGGFHCVSTRDECDDLNCKFDKEMMTDCYMFGTRARDLNKLCKCCVVELICFC